MAQCFARSALQTTSVRRYPWMHVDQHRRKSNSSKRTSQNNSGRWQTWQTSHQPDTLPCFLNHAPVDPLLNHPRSTGGQDHQAPTPRPAFRICKTATVPKRPHGVFLKIWTPEHAWGSFWIPFKPNRVVLRNPEVVFSLVVCLFVCLNSCSS